MTRFLCVIFLNVVLLGGSASARSLSGPDMLNGIVAGGGRPIAQSTVTLWAATSGEPAKVGETKSIADGHFALPFRRVPAATSYYLVAQGGRALGDSTDRENTAIRLLAVLGTKWPSMVTINELTTIASVWTSAQFITGTKIAGKPIGVQIAAGNVANFVDVRTGGYGAAIQDPLNGPQTPTLANFATLGDLLAGCVTRVTTNACPSFFAAATPPAGRPPTNTLDVAESIARNSWHEPAKVFALLDTFYPIPPGKTLRNVPFAPYLSFAPSAWVLALQFDGGGYRAGGKLMFDSHGNAWVPDNFTVGFQGQDTLWQGNLSEFAPNGEALSPITTGFTGGGFEGGSFGGAVDSKDQVWVDSYGGKSISVFDNRGKPLTPASGVTFGGQLGLMQGIIVMPGSGDVWALGITKNQLVYFPKGDYAHGRIVCEGTVAEPCKSMSGPFHLAVDQQNRIWVSNAIGNFVTRFPASDPTKAVKFETGGFSESGMNIDSQGNVWVTNRLAGTPAGAAVMRDVITTLKSGGNFDEVLTKAMAAGASGGGSVTAFRPDGTQLPGSPFTGPSLTGPWAIAIDGNDQVWISNFAHPWGQLAHLCGVRTDTCPPGAKTGDPISPPLGFVGGGLQMVTDLGIDPAGDVWENNNWQHIDQCFQTPPIEAWSTRCGGQGVTVFYGLARPVRTPQIGPNQPL